jgi:sn-glycerol 3-phosphate transport system permease protein
MHKRAIFGGKALPYLLLAPQLLVTVVFFYWPASQAVWQSFLLEDAFGLRADFVWLENYRHLLSETDYYRAMATTAVFSVTVASLSLSIALLLAVQADKAIKGAGLYTTLLIWP